MKKRRTSRIFQEQTTREIVEQVLALWRIPNRWHLAGELPKRAYCVQYEETDYAFVTRLCAAEGIFFSFESPSDPDGDSHSAERARAGDVVVSSPTPWLLCANRRALGASIPPRRRCAGGSG